MTPKPENPPAFPSTDANEESLNGVRGMTLRDYFIAHAPEAPLEWIKEHQSFHAYPPDTHTYKC